MDFRLSLATFLLELVDSGLAQFGELSRRYGLGARRIAICHEQLTRSACSAVRVNRVFGCSGPRRSGRDTWRRFTECGVDIVVQDD